MSKNVFMESYILGFTFDRNQNPGWEMIFGGKCSHSTFPPSAAADAPAGAAWRVGLPHNPDTATGAWHGSELQKKALLKLPDKELQHT